MDEKGNFSNKVAWVVVLGIIIWALCGLTFVGGDFFSQKFPEAFEIFVGYSTYTLLCLLPIFVVAFLFFWNFLQKK